MKLTDNDKRALDLIKSAGGTLESRPSDVGQTLYPKPKHGYAHDNRSAQGLALAGGKVMHRLAEAGLITIRCGKDFSTIYKLTEAGKSKCNHTNNV